MEGADLELECPCGYENFERVMVRRPGRPDHVSDFVACVSCKAVYHSPIERGAIAEAGRQQLVDDARIAARDYRKPSRPKRPGDRR